MRLAVVVPLLNERENLSGLCAQLAEVFARLGCQGSIYLVDDGSTDGSWELIGQMAQSDKRLRGIRLSRNFGHEAASTAGLDAVADADAVVLMDADGQDPPAVIELLVEQWRLGHRIVYARRRRRRGETVFKRFSSWLFYRILNRLSAVAIPRDVGDFRLIDARVLQALRQCREQDRFVRGLVAWTGFSAAAVEYDRPARTGGVSKYNPLKLLLLSLDAAVGFSVLPLRLATGLGFIITAASMVMVVVIVGQKLFRQIDIPGYALQTSALFFLGGVQMLLLGIVGEYIGRIYRQSQGRPLYLVDQRTGQDQHG